MGRDGARSLYHHGPNGTVGSGAVLRRIKGKGEGEDREETGGRGGGVLSIDIRVAILDRLCLC